MPRDLTKELQNYENKWVALSDKDYKVVGSGNSVKEARAEAQEKGITQVIFYKVFPFRKSYSS